MKWRYVYLAVFFIPLIIFIKNPIFTITGLDTFSVEDSGEGEFIVGDSGGFTGIPQPTINIPSGGSGGGPSGGGGGSETFLTLDGVKIIPSKFNLRGFVGISFSAKIYLKNEGNSSKTINLETANLLGMITFNEPSFTIPPGEEKIIDFLVTPLTTPDIYVGEIIATSGNQRASIPFTIRIISEISLFDIIVDLPERIGLGQNIISKITLTQAGLDEKEDVALIYEIKNSVGAVVLRETETIAIQGTKTFEKEFETRNFALGNYTLFGEVIYAGGVASSSKQFEIVEEISIQRGIIMYYLLLMMLIFASAIIITIIFQVSREKDNVQESQYTPEAYPSSYG